MNDDQDKCLGNTTMYNIFRHKRNIISIAWKPLRQKYVLGRFSWISWAVGIGPVDAKGMTNFVGINMRMEKYRWIPCTEHLQIRICELIIKNQKMKVSLKKRGIFAKGVILPRITFKAELA